MVNCNEIASLFVMLMDYACGRDELAEVVVKFMRQEMIEEGRA